MHFSFVCCKEQFSSLIICIVGLLLLRLLQNCECVDVQNCEFIRFFVFCKVHFSLV
jgi:hypothetical protein